MTISKQAYHFWTSAEIENLMSVIEQQKLESGKNRVNWKTVKDKLRIKNCTMDQIKAQYYNVLHDMRYNKARNLQKQKYELRQKQKQKQQDTIQKRGKQQQEIKQQKEISIDKLEQALNQLDLNKL